MLFIRARALIALFSMEGSLTYNNGAYISIDLDNLNARFLEDYRRAETRFDDRFLRIE